MILTDEQLEQHVQRLIEVAESIECGGKITILTGNNGSGKSFVKKVLAQFLRKKYDEEIKVVEESLNKRAGINGEADMFNRDVDWLPSSTQTYDRVIHLVQSAERVYVVLDEPEIGMSEEFQAALALKINELKARIENNTCGLMVITHSRQLVKLINADEFINIEGLSKQDWLTRDILPINPDELSQNTLNLMHTIKNHLK